MALILHCQMPSFLISLLFLFLLLPSSLCDIFRNGSEESEKGPTRANISTCFDEAFAADHLECFVGNECMNTSRVERGLGNWNDLVHAEMNRITRKLLIYAADAPIVIEGLEKCNVGSIFTRHEGKRHVFTLEYHINKASGDLKFPSKFRGIDITLGFDTFDCNNECTWTDIERTKSENSTFVTMTIIFPTKAVKKVREPVEKEEEEEEESRKVGIIDPMEREKRQKKSEENRMNKKKEDNMGTIIVVVILAIFGTVFISVLIITVTRRRQNERAKKRQQEISRKKSSSSNSMEPQKSSDEAIPMIPKD